MTVAVRLPLPAMTSAWVADRVRAHVPVVDLRDYQDEAVDHVAHAIDRDGKRRVVVVLPTGSGKTVVFGAMTHAWLSDGMGRVLVLAHRDELIQQAAAKLALWVPRHLIGIVKAGIDGDYAEGWLEGVMLGANAPDKIVEAWKQEAWDRPTIVFTPTVSVARAVAEAFNGAGVSSAWVSGAMPIAERRAALAGLASGQIRVIANCAVLTEGFDEPSVSCIVVGRPTKHALSLLSEGWVTAQPDDAGTWSVVHRPRRGRPVTEYEGLSLDWAKATGEGIAKRASTFGAMTRRAGWLDRPLSEKALAYGLGAGFPITPETTAWQFTAMQAERQLARWRP
jgi:hypothetical protein